MQSAMSHSLWPFANGVVRARALTARPTLNSGSLSVPLHTPQARQLMGNLPASSQVGTWVFTVYKGAANAGKQVVNTTHVLD